MHFWSIPCNFWSNLTIKFYTWSTMLNAQIWYQQKTFKKDRSLEGQENWVVKGAKYHIDWTHITISFTQVKVAAVGPRGLLRSWAKLGGAEGPRGNASEVGGGGRPWGRGKWGRPWRRGGGGGKKWARWRADMKWGGGPCTAIALETGGGLVEAVWDCGSVRISVCWVSLCLLRSTLR